MALAVTQAVKIEAASGTSVTANNAITFTAGALSVAFVTAFGGTVTNFAASDSINGTYSARTGQANGTSTGRFCDKNNISSGLANLTATAGAGAAGVVGFWLEVTGQDTGTAFDTENGGNGGSAAPDSVNTSNAQADSIYIAGTSFGGSGNPVSYTINASGSEGTWIEKDATNSKELNGNSFPAGGTVYQIVSSIAARSHTWTIASNPWAAAVVIYKMALVAVVLEQEGFRWRNDDGSETTATWKAAQDTNVTVVPDQTTRLRMLLNATGDPVNEQYKLQYRKVGDASWRDVDN